MDEFATYHRLSTQLEDMRTALKPARLALRRFELDEQEIIDDSNMDAGTRMQRLHAIDLARTEAKNKLDQSAYAVGTLEARVEKLYATLLTAAGRALEDARQIALAAAQEEFASARQQILDNLPAEHIMRAAEIHESIGHLAMASPGFNTVSRYQNDLLALLQAAPSAPASEDNAASEPAVNEETAEPSDSPPEPDTSDDARRVFAVPGLVFEV
jgi:hypothetical protein